MQKALTKFLIIAGPQSSGKTTVFNLLKKKYPKLSFVEEINQYSLVNKKHMGGAFVNREIEIAITSENIRTTKKIDRTKKVVIMETDIFHVVYLEKSAGRKTAEEFFPRYLKAHKGLNPTIIFIDTKPRTSFQRRRKIYLKRIKDAGIIDLKTKKQMLEKHKKNIYDLYPLWIKYYKKIPFKKFMIKNSRKTFRKFVSELENKAKKILED